MRFVYPAKRVERGGGGEGISKQTGEQMVKTIGRIRGSSARERKTEREREMKAPQGEQL